MESGSSRRQKGGAAECKKTGAMTQFRRERKQQYTGTAGGIGVNGGTGAIRRIAANVGTEETAVSVRSDGLP